MRAYPSGIRCYYVRFQYQGLRQLHVIGNANDITLDDARLEARKHIDALRYGVVREPAPSLTLCAFAEEFFQDMPVIGSPQHYSIASVVLRGISPLCWVMFRLPR